MQHDRAPKGLLTRLTQPSRAWLGLLPALVALLLGLVSVHGEMVWDDRILIAEDPFVHSLANVPGAFSRTFWAKLAPDAGRFDYYRPVTTVTYMLQYALSDGWSGPYHVVNALLYATTAGLLALTCAALGFPSGAALLAGLLFAVYPAHHENVNFISGRTDLLVGLFLLLALQVAHRDRREGGSKALRMGLLLLWTALAAFSKEIGYFVPIALLALEFSLGWQRRSLLRVGLPLLPVAAAALARHFVLLHRVHSPTAGLYGLVPALLRNSRALFWPWPLSLNNRVLVEPFNHPPWMLAAAWAVLVLLGFWALRQRAARLAWVLTWLFLLPSCLTGIAANRMLYLPSLFLLPLLAFALSRVRWRPALSVTAAAGLLLSAALAYGLAARVWDNEVLLFERLVQDCPADAEAYADLADKYMHLGSAPGAPDSTRLRYLGLTLGLCRQGLVIEPGLERIWFVGATALFQLNRDSLAVAYARRGLSTKEDSRARFVEGQALTRLGRYREALEAARKCLASPADRRDPERWSLLGWVQHRLGHWGEALAADDSALALSPSLAYVGYNRALTLLASGRPVAAQREYQAWLQRETDGGTAATALGDLQEFATGGSVDVSVCLDAFLDAADGRGPGAGAPPDARESLERAVQERSASWPALRSRAAERRLP